MKLRARARADTRTQAAGFFSHRPAPKRPDNIPAPGADDPRHVARTVADNRDMPEPAERVTRARVVDLLRIAEGIAGYAAREVGNGLGPDEARRAALEAAAELELAASRLRRLARPDDSAQRRAVAVELAAAGWPREAIAERLGVTGETARRYLRARPAQGLRA